MAKTTQSLDELRAQARLTFRYWHIYLMLRLRKVEQHLTESERSSLVSLPTHLATPPPLPSSLDLSILLEYGLLAGSETLPNITAPPPLALWVADDFFFRVGMTWEHDRFLKDFVSLDYVSVYLGKVSRLELLRVRQADGDALRGASEIFKRIAHETSATIALESARLWAVLHGARLLDWVSVPDPAVDDFLPSDYLTTPATLSLTPSLPPRKRGKGLFRDPS